MDYNDKNLTLLAEIVSQRHPNKEQQLIHALKRTTELLDLEVGIISQVVDGQYIVEYCYPENSGIGHGDIFPLKDTCCSITLKKNDVLSIQDMIKGEYKNHPCNEVFDIGTYIGAPLYVDGDLYGTINFSGAASRVEAFEDSDHLLVNLLADWAGGMIHRKQINEQLAREKELYKLISTNSSEIICLHEPEGSYTFVSESVTGILGYTPEELIGTNPYDYFHPEDQEQIRKRSHIPASNGNAISSMEYRIQKKDGQFAWFDTATQPVINDHGEVTALQTTSREVTERKRQEILFKQTQTTADVAGWEYDLETGALYWTDQIYKILERDPSKDIKVRETLNYFPDDGTRETLTEALQDAVLTGESYDLQLPIITDKGTEKYIRAIAQVEMHGNKAIKLYGSFQDVTARQNYLEKISEQNRILSQEKHSKEKLYSILAHDLRNSMYGITALLDLTIAEIEDEEYTIAEVLEKLKLVQGSSIDSIKLLENIQNWVKIQTRNFEVHARIFDLSLQLQLTLNLFRPSFKTKGITMNTDFENKMMVYGDAEMISTVLRNIINNAIKFSQPESSIDITVTENTAEESTSITIRDYGIGMTADILNNLFDSNNRPRRTGTKKELGTGLGLLLAKELTELNNGSLLVKTSEGKGTEFVLTFPNQENSTLKSSIRIQNEF